MVGLVRGNAVVVILAPTADNIAVFAPLGPPEVDGEIALFQSTIQIAL
jgi:hypothetical protein